MLLSAVTLILLAGCSSDADCTITQWQCCGCLSMRAVSVAELKAEEEACATTKCPEMHGCKGRLFNPKAVAVCKAGICQLSTATAGKPAKAECATASDCEVWCCQEDLQAAVKGKKPRQGCKRCPKPQPAAECLESKCAVAPHALDAQAK